MPRPRRVPQGIWAPWAEVLCRSCFLKHFAGQPLPEMIRRPSAHLIVPGPEHGVTSCDGCGTPVAVDRIVAQEHELVRALRARAYRAEMRRLPDGTSAVRVWLPYNCHLQIHGDVEGAFYISEHDAWGVWVPDRDREARSIAEAAAVVGEIYDRKLSHLAADADVPIDYD